MTYVCILKINGQPITFEYINNKIFNYKKIYDFYEKNINYDHFENIDRKDLDTLKLFVNNEPFSTNLLLSLILPHNFIYKKKCLNINETLKIYNGIIYEGYLDKASLGSSYNSIIHNLEKNYGANTSSEFITNIQFITNEWLLIHSFSIGLKDALTDVKTKKIINKKIDENLNKTKELESVFQKINHL